MVILVLNKNTMVAMSCLDDRNRNLRNLTAFSLKSPFPLLKVEQFSTLPTLPIWECLPKYCVYGGQKI